MKSNLKKIRNLFLAFVLINTSIKAQLSGPYAIPGAYATIAAAITDLNTLGVSGPVTFNIAGGFTETAPVGGYTLNTITGASSVNQITFQKSGVGANPLITAYVGVGTPSTAIQDGVWRFSGSDFITVNGIDINDPNTTNPATMEFGYGFFKASATNGCQNNTIKNCVITLNRVNNDVGSAPASDGSRGIDVVNAAIATHTTAITVTSAAGANSNNLFYSNTIQNCNIGIAIVGFAASSPFTLGDVGNDIGGTSAATGNTITNYGGGGTNAAAAGIATLRQFSINVSYNTINNNTGSGVNHAAALRGIYVNTATSATATIDNNTVTINGGGTTQVITAIENNSGSTAASNAIDISNNLITNCTYTGATSGSFNGILNSASPATLTINNNTFSNNACSTTSGSFYSISNSGAVASVLNMNNNLINLGTFNAASTSMALAGIYNTNGTSSTTLSANSNTFQNANFSGATGSSGSTYIIYNNTTQAVTNMNGNNFNNITLKTTGGAYLMYNSNSTPTTFNNNNIITTGFNVTGTGGGTVYGYYNFGSPGSSTALLNGNNFSNITLAGASAFYGIYQATSTTQVEILSNNVISNVTTGAATIYGLYHSYGAAGSAVTNNTVTGLYGGGTIYGIADGNTAPVSMTVSGNIVKTFSTSGASSVNGIYHSGGTNTSIYKNKIYDLSGNNAGTTVFGINVIGGTTTNIYNNLIGDLRASAASGGNVIAGISLTGGTTNNVYFNSVNLGATSTGANFGTSAISVNASPTTVNLRNNIFVNTSTAAGTGSTVGHRRASTALANFVTTSNNNLYYAGTPGAANLIYTDGTNNIQTLAAYKTLMLTRDASAVTENPPFLSTVGTSANFLNINTTIATQVESGALPIALVTDDYAGTLRSVTLPDIGAWEGPYLLNDITAPAVIASGFTTPGCITTGRTFTASINDVAGVASGTVSPKIYYKVNAGAYSNVTGTLTSGTANIGVWTFSLSYTAAILDIISWYMVVQDVATIPNLAVFPNTAGFVGTDVNTITTPPTVPGTYGVNLLNGIYNVGSGGTFTTLTAAANAYNTYCITGPVTFSLTDALYSTNETFPIVFQNNAQANATNSLLIIPASGVAVAITPTNTAITSVIKFLNAHNITMDGIKTGGRSLTINNANTAATSANIWLSSTNVAASGNTMIAVNNATINGGNNGFSHGINASIDAASPSTNGGQDNDNITISGNTVLNALNGLVAAGTATVSAGGLDNWSITGNTFGPAVSAANNLTGNGIVIGGAVNLSITANIVQNISTAGTNVYGINLNTGINGFAVSQNTMMNLTSSAANSGVSSIAGMYLGSIFNGTINANVISTIINSNTGGYGVRGMIINTTSSLSAISIRNNFITDVYCYTDPSYLYWPIGMDIEGSSGGLNIDNNSINLSGSRPGLTSTTGSAPIYIGGASGNISMRNNIISNTYDNSLSTTDIAYGIYSTVSANNFVAMDYNNYYVGGTGNVPVLCYMNGANRTNLYALQTNFTIGQNLNSLNFQPVYTSGTDLHLVAASVLNAGLNNTALPLPGITTDVDNQARSLSTPDIGADEFTASASCTSAVGGVISPATFTLCSTQTLLVTSTGISSGLGTTYNWQASPTAGGTYTSIASGTGSTNPTYFAPLAPGIYYMVLKSTCATGPLTGVSNEATVTVVAPPTPSITSTKSLVCQGSTATLTASGALTYLWGSGATTTTISIAPTANTIYTVTGTNVCPVVATISILYNALPILTITPTTPSVCANVQATLTASGANTYTWSTGSNNAVVNTTQSVNTTYTATGTNTNGCVSLPATKVVLVNQLPNIVITGPTGICTGDPATFTATGASTYTWSTGVPTNTMLDTPGTNTVYTATGTDINGCISSTSRTVNVSSTLLISIAGTQTSCPGFVVNLSASGANTYSWNTTAATITIAPTPTTTTTYSVVGTSGTCSNSAAVTITVNPTPTISITGNTLICPGITTTLTASGAVTFTWNTSAINSSITAAPTNTTNYSVVGTSSLGCPGTSTVTVATNTVPVLSIARSATIVCFNTPATFTASGATTYTWAAGPLTNTITVTPTVATIYTVSGTNPAGCISSLTTNIAINALPSIGIAPASLTVCSLSNAAFLASGASTYTWNANNALNTAAITFTPASATVYTVVGTNANGCVSSNTVAVATNSLPIMTFVPLSATVCALSPVGFTVSGANTYFWNNNNVTTPFTTFFPAVNTTYTVTGTTSQGCNKTATVAAVALPLPAVVVSPSFTTVCQSSTNTFTASGATSYTWNANNALNGTTQTFTTAAPTSYTISGTGANGCIGTSQFVVLTNALPVLNISAMPDTVCALQPVQMVANGASTFTWSGSGVVNDSTIVHPANNSTYTVTGTDGVTGCVGTQTIAVVTNPLPAITVSPASPTVCVKTPVTLTANGGSSYLWSDGSQQTNVSTTPTANVSYTVTGTDALGCSDTLVVTIATNPLPVVVITPASQTLCVNETVTYVASGANTYTWSVNNVTSPTFTATAAFTTFYSVTGTDNNNCKSVAVTTQLTVSDCTGLNKLQLGSNAVSVFPNPSTGFFTAQFEFEGEKTILVTNSMGQLVTQAITTDKSHDFDIGGLAKGVYFVKVSSKSASGNYKIVIE